MPTPQENLAAALEALNALQEGKRLAIRSRDLDRADRERLLRGGFLRRVMKGWYVPARPDEPAGESTSWYASFWDFCAAYLEHRFGPDWSLSPEQSLFLHAGNRSVPAQLLVRAPGARNKVTALPHGTGIYESRASLPPKGQRQTLDGLRVFSLPAALVASGPALFTRNPTEARTALAMTAEPSSLLAILLEGGHTVVAGRLAGAFRNIGAARIADEILKSMRAAGYTVRESDPFAAAPSIKLTTPGPSPHVNRMRLMWQEMRAAVLENFPAPPGPVSDVERYMQAVADNYVSDAYHSLSIEGYRVSRDLIDRVRRGAWDPDNNDDDGRQADALAARGYYLAFQAVQDSVRKVLAGANPGAVADSDHGDWYRALFAPSVEAGLLRPANLAGYRSDQVYIRNASHVPPRPEAVRDLMPQFFELLRSEESPEVRVVLGHYFFVYIHPYMDGNGRLARFLMNVMMAAGGYPWTVIPVERRDEYMAALEAVSARGDMRPFSGFLAGLLE